MLLVNMIDCCMCMPPWLKLGISPSCPSISRYCISYSVLPLASFCLVDLEQKRLKIYVYSTFESD